MTPYGLKGDIKVKPHSGETDHFLKLAGVPVELRKDGKTRILTILQVGQYGRFALVRFSGLESPETVHPFAGWELWAPKEFASPLLPGEFYVADLVGCELRYQGNCLAVVHHVWENGAVDMLDVETTEGQRVHVPFQAPYIGEVHLADRWIELLTEWILA